jgi:predicted O-methyltransferase YrrM
MADGGSDHDARWTAVDEYAFSKLHPSTSTPSPTTLQNTLANSSKKGLPDIAVSPSQGKFLKLQAQLVKAQNILELGTLGGYSTIWLADSSPSVRIVSIEFDAHHREVALENLAQAGFADRVDVRLGAGLDVLPQVAAEVAEGKVGKFDLVFIDADKENNWAYVEYALGIVNSGALIIVDNVVRKGKVAQAGTGDSRVEGARQVIEKIGADDRLDGVVLQTVGEKSYDGFVLAVVK